MIEKDRKSIEMEWKSAIVWRKTIEIAENWARQFRMQGGVKKHLAVGSKIGNMQNTVSESAVSNTELSEFFLPSPSSGKRTH